MCLEAGDCLLDGFILMRAGLIDLLACQVDGDLCAGEGDVPVDGGLGDTRGTDAVSRNDLVVQHFLRVLAPAVGGRDYDALGEGIFAVFGGKGATGFLEEGVKIALFEIGRRLVELALDCHPAVILAAASDEVDASI